MSTEGVWSVLGCCMQGSVHIIVVAFGVVAYGICGLFLCIWLCKSMCVWVEACIKWTVELVDFLHVSLWCVLLEL